MCGVGTLLFLIASTPFLSLIPIYLPIHSAILNYVTDRRSSIMFQSSLFRYHLIETQLFYIEYSIMVDNELVNYSAFITNLVDPTQQV
jgi:hypothetical protein